MSLLLLLSSAELSLLLLNTRFFASLHFGALVRAVVGVAVAGLRVAAAGVGCGCALEVDNEHFVTSRDAAGGSSRHQLVG